MEANPELGYRRYWLLVGYTILAVIIYLSITSTPVEIDIGFPLQDKLFHMLAYFVLMFWFVQIYHARKQLVGHALAFIAVGIAMEFIQSFDPARYAEYEDMIANTLGIVLAVMLAKTGFRDLLVKFERAFL
jgi:VanZ family protein